MLSEKYHIKGRSPETLLLDFVQITPPPPFGQRVQLFSELEIQYLKVSLGLKILYILYNILYKYNLKTV